VPTESIVVPLADRQRLLDGLPFLPRPEVSTWGLANLEISVPIGSFPVDGAGATLASGRIDALVGGVAANITRGLSVLGVPVQAHLVVADDDLGAYVGGRVQRWGNVTVTKVPTAECPRTVVLYSDDGERGMFMDMGTAISTRFPDAILAGVAGSALAYVTIARMGRPVVGAAAAAGVPVAVDLQEVDDIDSAPVRFFAGLASVLFLSGAALPEPERIQALRRVAHRDGVPIAVMGLGSAGAAMTTDAGATVTMMPAYDVRPVRSTLGAGDALAAGFLAGLVQGMDPQRCLHRACLFAGHKIGAVGATEGFLTGSELTLLEAAVDHHAAAAESEPTQGPEHPGRI